MNNELLQVEFRYSIESDNGTSYKTKKVTIGIFDLETAIKEGNKVLDILSNTFEIKDRFRLKGLFGFPDRLICSYRSKTKIEFFAKITKLDFLDLVNELDQIKKIAI